MDTYYSTQSQRPTPYITDGMRRYSGSDNPQYIIGESSYTKNEPKQIKFELTSDVQKTLEQTKAEMEAAGQVVKQVQTEKKKSAKRAKKTYKKKTKKARVTNRQKLSKGQPRDIFSHGR